MRFAPLAAALLGALLLAPAVAPAQDTQSDKGKLSYALGYRTGMDLANVIAAGEQVDMQTFIAALQDAAAGRDPKVQAAQLQAALEAMQARADQRAKSEFETQTTEAKRNSEAYLARNRTQPNVRTTPSGLQYRIIQAGNGPVPTAASSVQISYRSSLHDGTVVADTATLSAGSANAAPVTIPMAEVQMKGLREALLMMPSGSRWELVIPAEIGAGTTPDAGVLANQVLIFDLTLVGIAR